MGRRFGALIGGVLAVLLATAGLRSPAAVDGEEALFPAVEEVELAPAGALFVQGRRVHGAVFRTGRTVEEVIELHRSAWAEASVDLLEQPLPGGRLLSVLDVPRGRHLVVAARRVGERTEVVRGWSPLDAPAVPVEEPPLPPGWLRLGAVEDRLGGAVVRTWTAVAPLAAPAAERALRDHLAEAGWTGGDELRRGDALLEPVVQGAGDRSLAQLRLRERADGP